MWLWERKLSQKLLKNSCTNITSLKKLSGGEVAAIKNYIVREVLSTSLFNIFFNTHFLLS